MKYLCLIYDDEKMWPSMPKAEAETMMGEYFAFTEAVKQSGHYVGGNALQPTSTATCVRVRQGKTTTTDGPFAETKEQLGGYFVVDVTGLDRALELAAQIPGAKMGSIEVRPVLEMARA